MPQSTAPALPPNLAESLRIGSVRFGLASLLVFASWAFGGDWMYRRLGELGSYAAWTALFIFAAGKLLQPLIHSEAEARSFYGIFGKAFLSYALVWTVLWMAFQNQTGEWLGSLAGTLVMGSSLAGAFNRRPSSLRISAILFALHSAGYFTGKILFMTVTGKTGMLLWGAAYGLGFGAGIGYALHQLQKSNELPPVRH